MEFVDGKITEYTPSGDMTIQAKFGNVDRYIKCGYSEVSIMLRDSRTITNEQRKKIYAMLGEISDYIGEYPDIVKKQMKLTFQLEQLKGIACDFSLSNCSVELASAFVDFLVEKIIAWDIPLKQSLIDLCEDIRHYVYLCLKHKKCAVCGRKAELHHVDAVGMGYNRHEIVHEGMRALPLCRVHHTETHNIGNPAFMEKYHLEPIQLNKELCKVYKLKAKEGNGNDAYG